MSQILGTWVSNCQINYQLLPISYMKYCQIRSGFSNFNG